MRQSPARSTSSLVHFLAECLRGPKRKQPLYSSHVQAGFPSPADDYMEGRLDLNDLLVQKPSATFYVRVAGDSMIGAGINPGDLLVVDRSITPRDGKVVIAVVDGQLTVKRLRFRQGFMQLVAENPKYQPIHISEGSEVTIWGVVLHSIHEV